MMTPSTLAAYCYDGTRQKIQDRVDWLVQQRDALVQSQFGTGGAASSVIAAGENGKTAGFQIDLSGPDALETITKALELLGAIPLIAQATTTTYAAFDRLQR